MDELGNVADSVTLSAEVTKEQDFVDSAYSALDTLRAKYRDLQAQVAGEIAANPSLRADRDALAAHYGDEAARLESVENHLVFGSLQMRHGSRYHIGRVGLRENETPASRSKSADTAPQSASPAASLTAPHEEEEETESLTHQLLVDWRAPAARPFYQATAIENLGVVLRRHITTSLRRVVAVEDEVLDMDCGPENAATLQGEGALMAALSQARKGHMSDIVSTIQAEQDRIIRADLNAFLVVQGGPGTGKTALPTHRGWEHQKP